MLSMSTVNVISFNFLSLQILFTYFPKLILSNKSPGYHSGALFGVSLPLFRPKQKAVCNDFWLPQSLDLNEVKWGTCLLFPVLCLLKLACICVRQRDSGTEQLLPTKPPYPRVEDGPLGISTKDRRARSEQNQLAVLALSPSPSSSYLF